MYNPNLIFREKDANSYKYLQVIVIFSDICQDTQNHSTHTGKRLKTNCDSQLIIRRIIKCHKLGLTTI